MNNICYSIKEYRFNDPIFNNVNATYIIHLEGNGRLNNIIEQLKYYHPSKIVYIIFNKGFKKCNKDKYINIPPLDLIDAFFQCFKHANNNNYENILILEDDFIFDKKILDKNNSNKIDNFLYKMSKTKQIYIYHIGAITLLQSAFKQYHNRLYLSAGAHSCIYPKKFINHLLNNVRKDRIKDWDFYLNFNYIRYKYYKSLCYQTFPETDNSKYWDQGNIFLKYIFKFFKYVKIVIKLDSKPQPGFDIMEISSKIIFWFIIITIIINILFVYIYFIKYKKKNNKKYLLYLFYYIIFLLLLYPIIIIIMLLLTIYITSKFYN
jgi:hypothetical protein